MDVPNHLCFRALEADSLWLGWYCIRLTSRSHPPPSVRPSRSNPSWVSRLGRRCCWARQATMSHLSVSSLRLKVHSWLSLQQRKGLMPSCVWAYVLCVQSAVSSLCQKCNVSAQFRLRPSIRPDEAVLWNAVATPLHAEPVMSKGLSEHLTEYGPMTSCKRKFALFLLCTSTMLSHDNANTDAVD